MLALRFQFNGVLASHTEGQSSRWDCCPVLLKDGDFRRVPWLGFIDLEEAKAFKDAKAVKLDIRQYSHSVGLLPRWQDVPENRAVQGCLVAHGVYAVVEDGRFRLVVR